MSATAEPAHAAPLATGGSLILGQTNDANDITSLNNTGGSTPPVMLSIVNNAFGSIGLGAEGGSNGTGVSAFAGGATGSVGVLGSTDLGQGIFGTASSTGIGVFGQSSQGFGGEFSGGRAPLRLGLGAALGAPTGATGSHESGEIYLDSVATVWVCVGNGTPGTWVRLLGVASDATGGAITYLSKPIRLLDTRVGQNDANQNNGHSPCSSSAPTTVNVANVNYNSVQVPASAVGAIGNVTVLDAMGGGYLELVPSGAGFTGAANLAFGPGQIISNAFNVGLSGGNLDIIIGGSSVDVIVDLFAIVA